MTRLVLKFGGTSVADAQRIRKAAEIVVRVANQGHDVTVVVSAMGHTTDQLISLAEQVNGHAALREMDALLSTGEQVSCALMSMAIQSLGKTSKSFTGMQAGILTETKFGQAQILEINTSVLEQSIAKKEIPVVAGFQGVTSENEITTLGRGGSDTTAVALAAALKAERCDIYTDVGGVYSADPRFFSEARRLPFVSYDEMIELARAGAQVLNLRSVELAQDKQVAVRVRSTFTPEDEGTLVTGNSSSKDNNICSVACDLSQAAITLKFKKSVHDRISELLAALDLQGVKVDMLSLVNHDASDNQELMFTVEKRSLDQIQLALQSFTSDLSEPTVGVNGDIGKITVVTTALAEKVWMVARVFDTLKAADIPIEGIVAGDSRVSCLVPARLAREAVKQLHEDFASRVVPATPVAGIVPSMQNVIDIQRIEGQREGQRKVRI